jgi:hypothetical protein
MWFISKIKSNDFDFIRCFTWKSFTEKMRTSFSSKERFLYLLLNCLFFKEFSSRKYSCINNNWCISTWFGYSTSWSCYSYISTTRSGIICSSIW